MTTTAIKQKLHEFIEKAPEKKLKAFYTIIEDSLQDNDICGNEEFVTEMNRRERSYLDGVTKTVTLDEAVNNATKALIK